MSGPQQHGGSEKEVRKREEKGGDEKSWEEKWRRDPLNAASWALVIIWAGLMLLAENLGLLARLEISDAWGPILFGIGLIRLLVVLVRYVMPDIRRPMIGDIVFGVVMMAAGLGIMGLLDWRIIWPVVFIVLGASLLLYGLFGRRR